MLRTAIDEFYRAKAKECELSASSSKSQQVRDQWLKLAKDWHLLVKHPPKA